MLCPAAQRKSVEISDHKDHKDESKVRIEYHSAAEFSPEDVSSQEKRKEKKRNEKKRNQKKIEKQNKTK